MPDVFSLRVPGYCRHKASGQAVVRLADRDIYLGKYGSPESRRAYRRFAARFLEHGSAGTQPEEVTVLEVMAAYVRFARGYYQKDGKPTSEFRLVCEACSFIKRLYSRLRAAEFGPLALKSVRQAMIDAGYCRDHINKNISRIKRMFKWAAEEELIPGSVPQALWAVAGLRKGRTAARESVPVQPVDDRILEATLPRLPAVVADMVKFQRLTGSRPSEVCELRPCDVECDGDIWRYRPEKHKTEHYGHCRVIFIGPNAQQVLSPYLARDPAAYCFRPCDSEAQRRASRHAARKVPLAYGNRPGSNRKNHPAKSPGPKYETSSYRRAIHRACDWASLDAHSV